MGLAGGLRGRILAPVAMLVALGACGTDTQSLSTGDPLRDLITLDQLVVPGFTVTSAATHVDASVLAGGDAALASALAHDGVQSAASVEYQRNVDFATSNGPHRCGGDGRAVQRYRRSGRRLQRNRPSARRDCGRGAGVHRSARRRGPLHQRRAHDDGWPAGGRDRAGVARREPRQHHRHPRPLRRDAARRCAGPRRRCRHRTSSPSAAG